MTLLHLLGGQDYTRVVFWQVLALALIPMAAYGLARRIHNRYSGVLLAGLIILREANAIRLASTITTSNVKLLMADLPATLVAMAFMGLVIVWLKDPQKRLLALICGGLLGLAMLVRLEMALFLPAAALMAALILWPRRRFGVWLQSGLLAVVGIALILSPWVYRNYLRTGMWFIDNPYFSASLFLQRFHPEMNDIEIEDPDAAPAEQPANPPAEPPAGHPATPTAPSATPAAIIGPQAAPTATPTTAVAAAEPPFLQETGQAAQFVRRNIGSLAGVALGHALNSQVQSLLILPNGAQGLEGALSFISHRSFSRGWAQCCTGREAVRSLPYWREWSGDIPLRAAPGLLLNLILIAYGVQVAWNRQRWAGLALIALGWAYVAFNALFRNSGGRYMLPVDWIALLYFSIGLAQVTQNLYCYLTGRTLPEAFPAETLPVSDHRPQTAPGNSRWALPAAILGLFLLGCLLPLMEISLPKRFTEPKVEQMEAALLHSDQAPQEMQQSLQQFLENGAILRYGRGVYPRFFPANAGDDVGDRNPFAPRPYPRIAFFLAGPYARPVALPVDKKPERFPNASDVLLVLCPEREVLAVAIYTPNGDLDKVYLRAPFPSQNACPLPEESTDPS
jgi:hypothetical protein